MQLVIDDREQKVIPWFPAEHKQIKIEVRRITIGDYALYFGEVLLAIIERKTWKDLAATLRDGRAINKKKLLQAREATGCKIIYLIEGKSRYAPNKEFCHIPYKNLQSHLDHLIMRDSIFVIYADSPKDTATRLLEFAVNIGTLEPSPKVVLMSTMQPQSPADPPQPQLDISQQFPKSDLEIIYSIWRNIPNITDKTTSIFLPQYHISDLLLGRIPKNTIAALKYPNGAIIGKRADKIFRAATTLDQRLCIKILSSVPRITKKSAELILAKFEIKKILGGEVAAKDLALLQKTEKNKLGLNASNNIIKFLSASAAAAEAL